MQAWVLTFVLGFGGGYGTACLKSWRLRAALILILVTLPLLLFWYSVKDGDCSGQQDCMKGAALLLVILSPAWWLSLGLAYWTRRRKI